MRAKIGALLCACLSLSACASSEERLNELAQAMVDGGYATSFERMDQHFLDDLTWVGLGASDGCMSIIEVTNRAKLEFAADTGLLAASHAEVRVALVTHSEIAVNGRFVLARVRKSGEYCETLYGNYVERRAFREMEARHNEAVRYFRAIK
ncbi:hypothetical protein [Trueperella pyogenes]|uniref:hypothetical protein n=1 Tax=Trueperella pyogenes TaxID=1661 RepID=UPI003254BA19